jgi:hypothetical protein
LKGAVPASFPPSIGSVAPMMNDDSGDGTNEYEWMVGGHWVIHRVDVMMGGDHIQALELIGEHNAETNSYSMRAFGASGSFGTMTAHRGADGSWSIRGDGMRSTLWPSEDKPYMTAVWEREKRVRHMGPVDGDAVRSHQLTATG